MKVLLTNDDGINSEGIKTLDRILTSKGHEVWVCAPVTQRSACSHAVTLNKNIKISKVSERHYSCEGYPADCVLFTLLGALPIGRPDIVISGINQGFNISTDRHYSATIGAAEEAVLKGIPALAVSCETVIKKKGSDIPQDRFFEVFPFEDAAIFVAEHLQEFHDRCKPGFLININVPDSAGGRWLETTRGFMDFNDALIPGAEPETFKIIGEKFPDIFSDKIEETDYYTVFVKKLISVNHMEIET